MVQDKPIRSRTVKNHDGKRDPKGDSRRAKHRIHNVQRAGYEISLQHIPDPVRDSKSADQQHNDPYHHPVRMTPDPQTYRRQDDHFRQKRKNHIINQQVALSLPKPFSDNNDHQRYQHRNDRIHKITSEKYCKPGSSHDSREIFHCRVLPFPVHHLLIFLMELLLIRLIGAHISG